MFSKAAPFPLGINLVLGLNFDFKVLGQFQLYNMPFQHIMAYYKSRLVPLYSDVKHLQFKIEYGQEMPQSQTNPWHHEEEIQNNVITATLQQSNKLFLYNN